MPDTLINAKPCNQVGNCTSWDTLFCICDQSNQGSGDCTPASVTGSTLICDPAYDPGYVDSIGGLLGVYSTTATEASTLPSTGEDFTATWESIDNAKQDDGNFATISPTSATRPFGGFPDICACGTEYIVLTGFGFNIVPNARIWGIAVGAKGYAYNRSGPGVPPSTTIVYNGEAFSETYIWNVALMLNGTPYYRSDPGTNALITQVSTPADPFTMQGYQNCGRQVPVSPYPTTVCDDDGLPVLPYSQPLAGIFGGFPTMPKGYANPFETQNTPPDYLSTYSLVGEFYGTSPCTPIFPINLPGPNDLVEGSPIQKDFFISTIKQNWTVAEVNDPSFGVAISLYSLAQNFYVSDGGNSGGVKLLTVDDHQFLDCVGICVYYTLGDSTVPTGNPLAPCIPSPGCS